MIHGGLDGQDEAWRALDLVDHAAVHAAQKADRIGRGRIEDGWVVEGEERHVVTGDMLGQRRLARLAGSADQHDARVFERLADTPFDETRVHGGHLRLATD